MVHVECVNDKLQKDSERRNPNNEKMKFVVHLLYRSEKK